MACFDIQAEDLVFCISTSETLEDAARKLSKIEGKEISPKYVRSAVESLIEKGVHLRRLPNALRN